MSTLTEVKELLLEQEQVVNENEIVLFNDDVNTFDHVINVLVSVCNHTPVQAEQCAIIVHYKGQCTVKTGVIDELVPKCRKLQQEGLVQRLFSKIKFLRV